MILKISVSNGFRFRCVVSVAKIGFDFGFRFRWQIYFESVSVSVADFRFRWYKFFESVSVSVAKIFTIGVSGKN